MPNIIIYKPQIEITFKTEFYRAPVPFINLLNGILVYKEYRSIEDQESQFEYTKELNLIPD